MHVVTQPAEEVCIEIYEVIFTSWLIFDKVVAHLSAHRVSILFLKKANDFASGKNAIQILQETFMFQVLVCDNESYIVASLACANAKVSQILQESEVTIALGEGNLEEEVA
jgi:hypothetical protein